MADKFQLKAILSAVDKISPTLKKITYGTRLMHKTLRDVGNAGSELMRKIGIPAFLSFSAITFGAMRATQAAINFAGSVQDAADRTGEGLEEYQALSNMLIMTGGNAEDAEMAITKFNKGVADGATGADKGFAGLLKKLNIPLKDAKGKLIGMADVLPQLATAFAKNKDPAIQTRMAMELWGKSGTKLIPLMNALADGSISLEAAMKEVVSAQSIQSLDNIGDALDVLGIKAKNTIYGALAKMAPAIQPIIDSMSKWVTVNKDLIQSTIVDTLTQIANSLKSVDWKATLADIKSIVDGIKDTIKDLGGLKTVLTGLGIAWIAGPVAAILSIVGAVGRAVWALGTLLFTAKSTATGYTVMGIIPAINTWLGNSFLWLKRQVIMARVALAMGGVAGLFSAVAGSIAAGVLAMGTSLWGAVLAAKAFTLAILTSPLGIIVAIATIAVLIYKNWDKIKVWFTDFAKWIGGIVTKIADTLKGLMPDWLKKLVGADTNINVNNMESNNKSLGILGVPQNKVNGSINVNFNNAPAGMRVDAGKTNQSGLSLNPDVGYRRGLEAFAL